MLRPCNVQIVYKTLKTRQQGGRSTAGSATVLFTILHYESGLRRWFGVTKLTRSFQFRAEDRRQTDNWHLLNINWDLRLTASIRPVSNINNYGLCYTETSAGSSLIQYDDAAEWTFHLFISSNITCQLVFPRQHDVAFVLLLCNGCYQDALCARRARWFPVT